jgi:NADH-quinone oxidoreductase subunit N
LPGAALGTPLALIGFLLFFAGLAFKIAAVPFHVYAADVYEGAAAPITGMLGFVPKLAGFVALIKILAAFEWNLPQPVAWAIWIVAAATMTTGNTLALLQKNVKRMLAYSSIAHTGYMLVAVLAGPASGSGPLRDGIAAMLFYIVVYGTMNLGAFAMLAGFRRGDTEVETLEELAGISRRAPGAALAFAVCVFSLMGIPPTAGFLGKVYIFSSALSLSAAHPMRDAMIVLVVIGVINTAIGAAYYLRIVATAYLGAESAEIAPSGGTPVRWGLALCSIPLIVLFVRPALVTNQAARATLAWREPAASAPVARLDGGRSEAGHDSSLATGASR